MGKTNLFLLTAVLFLSSLSVQAALPKSIATCDDGDEWPPYAFYERSNGKASKEVTGYSLEMLKEILKAKNVELHIELIPWKRCLEKIKAGKAVAALNATINDERKRDFLISKPYYALTEAYVASSAKAPKIASAADLLKYNICGQRGYNYEYLGVFQKNILSTVDSFANAIKQIKTGRCDLIPVNREILVGYHAIGEPDYINDPELLTSNIPGVPGTPYVMLVSKKIDFGPELLATIDEGVAALEKSGFAKQLRQKYKIE